MTKKKKKKVVKGKFHSAKSGKYVKPEYAAHHPATTVKEKKKKK